LRNPNTAYRSIGDEGGLLVLPDKSQVKVLNPTGATIFGLLDGEHTIDEMIVALLDQFDVTPAQARADIEAFLAELESEGLLAPDLAAVKVPEAQEKAE
jgi:hypothetical protein